MNCDQAFDALTDISQRNHRELCRHLDDCARCRDMADLLDPALNLFGDVTDRSSDGDAGTHADFYSDAYSDETSPAQGDHADGSQSSKSVSHGLRHEPWLSRGHRRIRPRQDGLKVAAFLMLIAVMMAAIVNVERGPGRGTITVSLPENCLRNQTAETAPEQLIAGCVSCHLNSTSMSSLPTWQRSQATQLVQRCVSCHLEMSAEQHLAELHPASPASSPSNSSVQLASCLFGHRDG